MGVSGGPPASIIVDYQASVWSAESYLIIRMSPEGFPTITDLNNEPEKEEKMKTSVYFSLREVFIW